MPEPEVPVEGEDVTVAEQSEPEPEVTHEGFIALDKHQKDINVQHKKFRDQERARIASDQRGDGLQKQLDDIKAEQGEVDIPPVPDQYSDTYAEDIAARDEAIKLKADQDAEQTRLAEQREKDAEHRTK